MDGELWGWGGNNVLYDCIRSSPCFSLYGNRFGNNLINTDEAVTDKNCRFKKWFSITTSIISQCKVSFIFAVTAVPLLFYQIVMLSKFAFKIFNKTLLLTDTCSSRSGMDHFGQSNENKLLKIQGKQPKRTLSAIYSFADFLFLSINSTLYKCPTWRQRWPHQQEAQWPLVPLAPCRERVFYAQYRNPTVRLYLMSCQKVQSYAPIYRNSRTDVKQNTWNSGKVTKPFLRLWEPLSMEQWWTTADVFCLRELLQHHIRNDPA